MCGIAGIWNLNGRPVDRGELDRMTDIMAHRGPDGRGTHVDDAASLGLGHRRLSILDLSDDGRQPFASADGRYHISYNGEIYNFLELRSELETAGFTFHSQTDTEVVLNAFIHWGDECQLKLNGMWAFAIWDSRERTLFLSRDRFGIKPLHYYHDGIRFAFASELRPFLALDFMDGSLDPAMHKYSYDYPSKAERMEQTILPGVKRLAGGYSLILKHGGGQHLTRWWNTLDHITPATGSFEDQVETFKELFADACRLRMRSDTAIGTALSGGMDSGSVLSMMSRIGHTESGRRLQVDWQRAFIGAYRNTRYDEEPEALMIASQAQATPHSVLVDPARNIDELDRMIAANESVCWDVQVGPWRIYEAMRNNGVYVSLDGHGGDELFGGYHHHVIEALGDALRPLPRLKILAQLLRLYRDMHVPEAMVNLPILCNLDANTNYTSDDFPDYQKDMERTRFDRLTTALYAETHFTNLPTNLKDFDRISMAHGVEVRTPFLDWRLACFAFGLPGTSKVGGGMTKRILREGVKGLMPEAVRTLKRKVGFASPLDDWKEQIARGYLMDAVNDPRFVECGLFDGKELRDRANAAWKSKNYKNIPNLDREIMTARLESAMLDTTRNVSAQGETTAAQEAI
ncbi:asparagine synthase (glutamine-hydrolyzing) [Pseudodesulfovibrio sp.]|nr:asparagine synthase (glutamine-hydrolyzing) [Pseudodesulfovibrio sp.]